MSVSTRCLYGEGDSAIFSPLQGQTSLALKYSWNHPAAGDYLPGMESLLRFFKKHNLSLCQVSPCCSERHLARTVPVGVKKATSAFCSRACLPPLLISWESIQHIFEEFLNWRWISGDFETWPSQVGWYLACPMCLLYFNWRKTVYGLFIKFTFIQCLLYAMLVTISMKK